MNKRQLLESGQTVITSEKGNSMTPLIKSGQQHKLEPCNYEDIEKGDIVYCKVGKRYFTHLVTAKDKKRGLQISNNHRHVNGWTKKVYGKVTELYENT